MNRAAVTGQKRVIAQAFILNVRLEQLAVVLDNDLRLPDEPVPTAIHEVEAPEEAPVYYYYDLNGRRSMSPHDRFNIVVKQQGPHTRVTKSYRNDD